MAKMGMWVGVATTSATSSAPLLALLRAHV